MLRAPARPPGCGGPSGGSSGIHGRSPFLLELRSIAATWKAPQDSARSVESYLADALSGCAAADPDVVVEALLSNPSGPRVVLLLDGWDELGGQGERLRERLVEFCRAFPHVVVVVTSRPYGETRPASAESFETVHIQPLSDADVRILATHFHRLVHGHDEPAAAHATAEFMAALTAAPDARSLAGTVLLLTMMLLLSREGPLPDRRHKLYTACLRNMLLHRVTQRERDGVVIDPDQQWRPDDSEERLRVVAELAYRMQTEGYESAGRAPMVRAWSEAVGLLSEDWTWDRRERFLRWLVASAGVLIDRADGSVQFAHLSFQEHLAAYYLFITREGNERIDTAQHHMVDRNWWETLRLWTALIGDHWPDKLGPVLDVLRADIDAYWLAGQMFADGTGRLAHFHAWVAELPTRLADPSTLADNCASAWQTSKQEERRSIIAEKLAAARQRLHWIEGIWHVSWCELAGLEVAPAPALLELEAPLASAAAMARSRALHGASATWPDGGELVMLRLWPSRRVTIGVHLQTAISLGAQLPDLVDLFLPFLARAHRSSWSGVELKRASVLAKRLDIHLGWNLVRNFFWDPEMGERARPADTDQHFIKNLAHDLIRELLRVWGPACDRDFVKNYLGIWGRYINLHSSWSVARRFGWYFIRHVIQYSRDSARALAAGLDIPESLLTAPWLSAFLALEVASVTGRASPRVALAHASPSGEPLRDLFRVACQASVLQKDMRSRMAAFKVCNAFDGSPLWPALARHVARISTDVDREFLTDLARHPERCASPLSWGLQHYVRGDLVLDDGTTITLDELSARAGLPPLPLLEEVTPEIKIPISHNVTIW